MFPHFIYTIGSQMTVRLSAIRAGSLYLPRRFLVLISVRDVVDPRAIVRLEVNETLSLLLQRLAYVWVEV
jgi:hypothetical protein